MTQAVRSDETDTWARALIGERPAFGELFDRHFDRVYRHSLGILGKTPSGIGLGATQAELLATYPNIKNLTVTSSGTSTFGQAYCIEDAQGRWLTFQLDEKALVGEIDVDLTEGPAGEFC